MFYNSKVGEENLIRATTIYRINQTGKTVVSFKWLQMTSRSSQVSHPKRFTAGVSAGVSNAAGTWQKMICRR